MRTIRISLRLDENTAQAQVLRRMLSPLRAAAAPEGFEIEVGSSITENVDLTVVQQLRLADADADGLGRLIAEVKSFGGPYIILERLDGANITNITRRLLCSDVPPAAVWKTSRYAHPTQYNEFSGRWHLELCKKAFGQPTLAKIPRLQIPTDRLDRIKAPFGFGSFEPAQRIVNGPSRSRRLRIERPIDVSFAGSVSYDDSVLAKHRALCWEAIGQLWETIPRITTKTIRGRGLDAKGYADLLYDAKVAVCPYGWGEECYREFEAIFAGCIVIKPFIHHIADPFKHCACRPDFSDLTQVVSRAIEAWNGGDLNGYDELADRCDPRNIGRALWADIRSALNGG
jgi:hypothetical protein